MKISTLPSLYVNNRTEFRRVVRYLAVGGWNTIFGIGLYALLYFCFGREINYLVLAIPANILAITNAYICYKLLVFKTKGNIVREYFKCCAVYGAVALAGMLELFILVDFFHMNPVAAAVVGTVVNTVVSYLGHKYFSFRKGGSNVR